ncbi:MAG: hypothetical protein AMXMBFR84_21990 [Candidatus Hydrogenedentota bacterium]
MYEAFYGLKEKPFNLTPDPKFVYLSEKHKEAFAHLLYGIKNRSGFVMVTGEIGTGKTTICRTLVSQLDDATEVAFIFNPCLSPDELLRKINEDFGIKTKAETIKGLIDELNAYLLDRNAMGKNCVLVIDEAQDLTPGVLEQIRLLSNLETEKQKLLQIVLIGQPELNEHLALDELRQLNQRITARYHLQPLNSEETVQYIAYRLRIAGARRRIHFARSAFGQIFKYAKGTPRVINAICDRALLIGYTRETHNISADIIKQAAREIQGERPKRRKDAARPRLFSSAAIIAAALIVLAGAIYAVERGRTPNAVDNGPSLFARLQSWMDSLRFTSNAGAASDEYSTDPDELPPGVDPREYWRQQNLDLANAVVSENDSHVPDLPEQTVTFTDVIDGMDPAAARTGAAAAILRAWNMAFLSSYPKTDDPGSFVEFAGQYGLVCEVLRPALEQVEMINLPALVRMKGRNQNVWCAFTAVEGDQLRLTTGMSDSVLVSRQDFKDHYMQEALILWRDPSPDTPTMKLQAQSDDVQVLQAQLRTIGLFRNNPNGVFDEATENAIKQLQQDTGLHADGAAGRQTRMVMCSWLPGFDTPELRTLPMLWSNAGDIVLGGSRLKWRQIPRPLISEETADAKSNSVQEPPMPTSAAPQGESSTKDDPTAEPPIKPESADTASQVGDNTTASDSPSDVNSAPQPEVTEGSESAPDPDLGSSAAAPNVEITPPTDQDSVPTPETDAPPSVPSVESPAVVDARNSTFPLVPSESDARPPNAGADQTAPVNPADTETATVVEPEESRS